MTHNPWILLVGIGVLIFGIIGAWRLMDECTKRNDVKDMLTDWPLALDRTGVVLLQMAGFGLAPQYNNWWSLMWPLGSLVVAMGLAFCVTLYDTSAGNEELTADERKARMTARAVVKFGITVAIVQVLVGIYVGTPPTVTDGLLAFIIVPISMILMSLGYAGSSAVFSTFRFKRQVVGIGKDAKKVGAPRLTLDRISMIEEVKQGNLTAAIGLAFLFVTLGAVFGTAVAGDFPNIGWLLANFFICASAALPLVWVCIKFIDLVNVRGMTMADVVRAKGTPLMTLVGVVSCSVAFGVTLQITRWMAAT